MLNRVAPKTMAAAFRRTSAAMRTTLLAPTRGFSLPSWGRSGQFVLRGGGKNYRGYHHNSGRSEEADGFVLWGGRVAGLLVMSGGAVASPTHSAIFQRAFRTRTSRVFF